MHLATGLNGGLSPISTLLLVTDDAGTCFAACSISPITRRECIGCCSLH